MPDQPMKPCCDPAFVQWFEYHYHKLPPVLHANDYTHHTAIDCMEAWQAAKADTAQPACSEIPVIDDLPNEAIIAALEASLKFRDERGLDDVQPDSPGGIPAEMVRVVYRAIRPYLHSAEPMRSNCPICKAAFSEELPHEEHQARHGGLKPVMVDLEAAQLAVSKLSGDKASYWRDIPKACAKTWGLKWK